MFQKPDKNFDTSDGSMVSTLQMCHWTEALMTGRFPLSTVRQQTTMWIRVAAGRRFVREVLKRLRSLQTVQLFERRTSVPHSHAQ